MTGRKTRIHHMPEQPGLRLGHDGVSAFGARLVPRPDDRLGTGVAALVDAITAVIYDLRPDPDEFAGILDYLTEVGHAADTRRQEWVLLADALGLSSLVTDLSSVRPAGCTPNTVAGPFYRPDAPLIVQGGTISLDGRGEPLDVSGRILSLTGDVVAQAQVEIWQANGDGKYENQEPDLQPENNLRGRMICDSRGRFHVRTVMPAGYTLPSDGPVGALMRRIGVCLQRPAHLHFRVSAPGHEKLTTHIFDRADPAIGRDPIFGVKPELLADFKVVPCAGGRAGRKIDLDLVLCPLG